MPRGRRLEKITNDFTQYKYLLVFGIITFVLISL